MKYLLALGLFVLNSSFNWAQTDTVEYDYSDPTHFPLFSKNAWSQLPGNTYNASFLPKRDTLYLKKDSSLFNGYLSLYHAQTQNNDTLTTRSILYKVINGSATYVNSIEYSYLDLNNQATVPWMKQQGFVNDSARISRTYYYYGQLFCESIYLEADDIRIRTCYDTSGTKTFMNRTVNGIHSGENYRLLNECCGLTILYEAGIIKEFKATTIVYFNRHSRIISQEKFMKKLSKRAKLQWGYQILDESLLQKRFDPTNHTIMLYLTTNEPEFFTYNQQAGTNQ